jgi:competence protein ComEC
LGLIALAIAYPIGWLAWLFLSYMLLIVNGFAALPISSIEVGSVSPTLIWVYYLVLALTIWLNNNRHKLANLMPKANWLKSGVTKSSNLVSRLPKRWIIPPLLVMAILVSVTAATMPDDQLHVSFLDVGEGDAILIQTPAHQDILVDGGPSPQAISLGIGKKMPFWDRTIDLAT